MEYNLWKSLLLDWVSVFAFGRKVFFFLRCSPHFNWNDTAMLYVKMAPNKMRFFFSRQF